MKPMVIYGAGGFGAEVLELVRDINREAPTWNVLGFIDDDESLGGSVRNGLEVLGTRAWLREAEEKPFAALAVGSPAAKRDLSLALDDDVAGFPALVHPTVVHGRSVELGKGVLVTAGNVLTTNIRVHDFVTVNLMGTVGHDSVIGPYVTLSPAVNVSGECRVGEGCDVGTAATLLPGVSVGEWSLVGAGAVVTKDLPANCTAVGVPAKVVREREVGWHRR